MIDRGVLAEALSTALRYGGDFAEIFIERKTTDNLRLEDRKIESFTSGIDRGAGLRVISGAATYFIHTDILKPAAVLAAAAELAAAVKAQRGVGNPPALTHLKRAKSLIT